jgi:hypothetical protein
MEKIKTFIAIVAIMLCSQAIADIATVRTDPSTTFENGNAITGEVFYRVVSDGVLVSESQELEISFEIPDASTPMICGQTKVIQEGVTSYSKVTCRGLSDNEPAGMFLFVERGQPYGSPPSDNEESQ